MVAYNFKKQFAPKVAALEKLQTIRGIRKRHAIPGETIQFYTGMRTRYCQKLVTPDPVCVSVAPIVITASSIQLDGLVLLGNQVDDLAVSDGFESASDLFEFFKETHGFPFSGVLIRWRAIAMLSRFFKQQPQDESKLVNPGRKILLKPYCSGWSVIFGNNIPWWAVRDAIERLNIQNERWFNTNRWDVDVEGLVGRDQLLPSLLTVLEPISDEVEVRGDD